MKKKLTRGPHLSYSHPPFFLCGTVRSNGADTFPKLPRCVVAVVEADPVFPAIERRQVIHALFPELATCLAPSYASPCSPSPSSARHGRRLSSSCSSAESASSAPRISNPPQPKLDNLPSFLLDPSFTSLIDQIARNRSFSGRQPLKPAELHSAVELLPRVPVLFD